MDFRANMRKCALGVLIVSCFVFARLAFAEEAIKGQVLGGGAPIAKSAVTLWEASAGAPQQLADQDGRRLRAILNASTNRSGTTMNPMRRALKSIFVNVPT